MSYELVELKKLLKTKSQAQVAVELGYRSATTVFSWLRDERLPPAAAQRLRIYLNLIREMKKNDNTRG